MTTVANQTEFPVHFLFPDDKSPKFVYRPPNENDPKYKAALEALEKGEING